MIGSYEEKTVRHAEALRNALDAHGPGMRQEIMQRTGKSYRSVSNWISLTSPAMPTRSDRATLRELLGDYEAVADPVEAALKASGLDKWRWKEVHSCYERHVQEQGREAVR